MWETPNYYSKSSAIREMVDTFSYIKIKKLFNNNNNNNKGTGENLVTFVPYNITKVQYPKCMQELKQTKTNKKTVRERRKRLDQLSRKIWRKFHKKLCIGPLKLLKMLKFTHNKRNADYNHIYAISHLFDWQ
jgi:hypothetical protein